MKRIRKGIQPAAFSKWKGSLGAPPISIPWENLPSPPRGEIREALQIEQRKLCCYCSCTIDNGAFHIGHFKPRSKFFHLSYDWTNLLASCQGLRGSEDLVITRRHCGEAKGDWFEIGITVDPMCASVESLFRFPLTGKIFAAKTLSALQKSAVNETIEKLNLNAPSLVRRRENILIKANEDAQFMGRALWCSRYLNEHGGQLQEFWPALKYNFDKLWRNKFANP